MLNGNLISLRALEPADLDVLYEWENDTSIWIESNTKTPYSRIVLEEFLNTAKEDIYTTKQLRLVIMLNSSEKAIGFIDLFDFDPQHLRAGLGILIANKELRGKGYGTEALKLMIDYGSNHLNIHQLYCHVQKSNDKSVKLFERAGFKITGELIDWIIANQQWENVYILQRISSD